jgi:hypothetical protein
MVEVLPRESTSRTTEVTCQVPVAQPEPGTSHYQRALEHYDQAKHLLTTSETAEDVVAIEHVADARYHRAAVIALRDGEPLPQRRDPCFFDPRHGPSVQDVAWAPEGGTPRTIGVCAADARRLSAGEQPLVRLVRVGDRWVPWHLSAGVRASERAGDHLARHGYGDEVRKAMSEAYIGTPGGAMSGFGGGGGPAG